MVGVIVGVGVTVGDAVIDGVGVLVGITATYTALPENEHNVVSVGVGV